MDIKKSFINCMAVLCVIVIIFSIVTVVKKNNASEEPDEITYNLIENPEIVMDTELLSDTEITEDAEVDDETEQGVDTRVLYTISRVNVRTGPATSYASLGEVPMGTEVYAEGELDESGWQKVIYNGQEAYILGNYLTDELSQEE